MAGELPHHQNPPDMHCIDHLPTTCQPMLGWQAALAYWPYSQDELDSEEFQMTDSQSAVVEKALQVGLPCSTSPACQLLQKLKDANKFDTKAAYVVDTRTAKSGSVSRAARADDAMIRPLVRPGRWAYHTGVRRLLKWQHVLFMMGYSVTPPAALPCVCVCV